MKIEVNVSKTGIFVIVLAVVLIVGGLAVYAYGGNTPSIMGHTIGEISGLNALAQSGSVYAGLTSQTYTGNLGGFAGANAKCNATYVGSHICKQSEMIASGATNFGGEGWVACESVSLGHGNYQCNLVSFQLQSGNGLQYETCDQYTSAEGSYAGPTVNSLGTGAVPYNGRTCNTQVAIHCCK